MLDKKIRSVRKVFYLRAAALDVIFSVGFGHITPAEGRENNFVSLRRKKSLKNFPFVNGLGSGAVDLISRPLEQKLHLAEGIRQFLHAIV